MNIYQFLRWKISYSFNNLKGISLLKQFDDIVIFQYNLKKDYLSLIPHNHKFMNRNCHQFLEQLQDPCLKELKDIFLGQGKQHDRKQFQIDNNWVLIEYHYIYYKGTIVGSEGFMININDFKESESMLIEIAKRDGLTHLYNKVTVEELIAKEMKQSQQGSLLMIDIDRFKSLNDQYGHLRGDEILKQFAWQLRTIFKDEIIGRIGGDEFVIYLKDYTQESILAQVRHLCQQTIFQDSKLYFSISVGIAIYNGKDSYKEFFKKADKAMYKAKHLNDKKFHVYNESTDL